MNSLNDWHHDSLLEEILANERVLLNHGVLSGAELVGLALGEIPLKALDAKELVYKSTHSNISDLFRWRRTAWQVYVIHFLRTLRFFIIISCLFTFLWLVEQIICSKAYEQLLYRHFLYLL